MAPRRPLLLLLSAIALLTVPMLTLPRQVEAATVTFFVDTTGDNATANGCTSADPNEDCSLRQAIAAANAHTPASDTKIISFQYFTDGQIATGGATFAITNTTLLPAITANNVQLIANTNFGVPKIQLNGNGKAVGLQLKGDDGLVKGLSIYGLTDSSLEPFFGAAIYITGDRNKVETSYIGINPAGDVPAGLQNESGIRIDGGGTANVIGGSGGEAVANYIAGNTQNGVLIRDSSGNFIQNNFIGLGRLGTTTLPRGNGFYGVQVISVSGTSSGNVIGGTTTELANVIGNNGRAGILLRDPNTSSSLVQANYIGVNKVDGNAIGNTGDGILLENGTTNNIIGGVAAAPLIVSGNTGYGIHVRSNGSAPGGNKITATTYIGTNLGGTAALPNDTGGILVDSGASGTTIEGSGNALRVAGNSGPGITIQGDLTSSTTISATLIGIVPIAGLGAPSSAVPNTGGGIFIDQASNTSVISSTISGNAQFGVRLNRAKTSTVRGNYVGPNLARTGTFPNQGVGVELVETSNTTLWSNTISGHPQAGLNLRGAASSTVLSNTVTANAGGLLLETSAVSATIGSSLTGNTVSGNSLFGIRLSETLTTTLLRNYVGLSTTRSTTLANDGNGIEVLDAVNSSLTDSFVAGNNGVGILVSGANTQKTTINNSNIGLMQATVSPFGYNVQAANALEALRITSGATNTLVSGGVFGGAGASEASPVGILIETSGVTVTGAVIGGVKETTGQAPPTLPRPFGAGILVTGSLTDVQLLNNTFRFNKGAGIKVEGNAQAVRLFSNKLTGNGASIDLVGTTLIANGPGSLTNPNHDIDPPVIDVTTFSNPLRLQVGDQGVISGFVITSTAQTADTLSPPSACNGCSIQLFAPIEGQADGQGWTLLGTRAVGDFSSSPVTSFLTNADGSYTRQIAGGIDVAGKQLLLIATDKYNNSSTFAAFPVSSGYTLTSLTSPQTATPGQTVTYTLRISNTGTLDLTGLRLATSGTRSGWTVRTDPLTDTVITLPTPLEAGTTRLITVSLTLPTGANPNVAAGVKDVTTVRVYKEGTTVSQTVQLETTVLPAPVIVVSPTTSLGKARQNERVPHTHSLRNNGNVPVTVNLSSTTLDRTGLPNASWETTLTPSAISLAPGEERSVRVDVLVPNGAQVEDEQGLVQAQTYVTATVPLSPTGGFGPVTVTFTDTTRVDLDPDASITDGDQELPGAAGQPVIFTHFVRNESNAPTRFCFIWSTSLGSTVTFQSRTDDFVIDANGCFDLDTTELGRQAQFDAVVLVNERALPNDREIVNISLRNAVTGETIGSARVVDRVNVLLGLLRPRIWLPSINS